LHTVRLYETRQYNSLFQLTRLTEQGIAANQTLTTLLDIQYAYPSAGSNNGKLASQTDVLSGEQVVYTYDALSRLATRRPPTTPASPNGGRAIITTGSET
jgi:hypothetical protein